MYLRLVNTITQNTNVCPLKGTTYLYTVDYNDEGAAASAQYYMVNETEITDTQAVNKPATNKELLRHAKMINNVAVYAVAQKYDTSELKELATAKFRELLWADGPSHSLPDIISAVFETTSVTDPDLRTIAVEYCAHNSTQIIADERLCSIIKDHGELGLDVLREVDEYANDKSAQKELLHGKLVNLKGELLQMVRKGSQMKAAVKDDPMVAALLRQLEKTYDKVTQDLAGS